MNLWQMTKAEFLGPLAPTEGQDNLWALGFGDAVEALARQRRPGKKEATYTEDCDIVPVGTANDLAAIDPNTDRVLGGLIGDSLAVDPEYAGMGVGKSLALAAWQQAPWAPNTPIKLSHGGAAVLRAIHKDAVQQAIWDKLDVPAPVQREAAWSWRDAAGFFTDGELNGLFANYGAILFCTPVAATAAAMGHGPVVVLAATAAPALTAAIFHYQVIRPFGRARQLVMKLAVMHALIALLPALVGGTILAAAH